MHRFLLALFACLLTAGCSQADVDFTKPLDLQFTAIDGRKVDLAQLRGKVVLVDFWATWCPPCVAISPDILGLYKKYHDQGLEIVGVSADSDKSALQKFVKEEGAPWPQYFDDKGDNVLLQKNGIEVFPTVWLVNKKGIVVDQKFQEIWWSHEGKLRPKTAPDTLAKIDAAIEAQLKAP